MENGGLPQCMPLLRLHEVRAASQPSILLLCRSVSFITRSTNTRFTLVVL